MTKVERFESASPSCDVCECLAGWEPVIYTWPTGGKGLVRPTEYELDMPVCDKHRMELRTSDFLCQDVWVAILDFASANGLAVPDRMTCEVRFRKIEDQAVIH